MKKCISLILVFVFVSTLCGCAKDRKNDGSNGIDIGYYLSVGQIKEAQFHLGTKIEEIENAKLEHYENATGEGNHAHEEEITLEEGVVSKHYIYGPFYYYFNKSREDKGISFIVSFDTAYDFMVGVTSKTEVITAVEKLKYTEKIATEDDLFFMMFSVPDCEMITCESGKYKLSFFFNEGILMCTTICNTENWSLEG